MAGYTRNDTSNNIATGNVINAADLDGEFDALVAAFHASTGHTHDGTAANGAPITKIGPAQDLVISTGAITPKTDNTVDLGSSSFEFKDLYIDGTANIDALVADTADINAGTIDGVTLGTNSAVTEAQIDNININGNTISSTDTNGNISLVPNGTGDVILTADTIQVGDSNTDVTVTTNGTGDLIFNTNAGTNSGVIRIYDGANGNIALTPNGTGEVDISKVDIDSGAIDGTAIGANSASTGAFTTLSASSTVTLSGGTANGVLYLNGSKVATSGSALTFDGTTLTNTQASGAAQIAFNQLLFTRNGANYITSTLASLQYEAATNHIFSQYGGSELMRLTSTGLGIGTSSPNRKLEVNGISRFTDGTTNAEIACGGGVAYFGPQTNSPLAFQTNNTERMRLDSSGNLGLGVTPSAWNVGKVMQISTGGAFVFGDSSQFITGVNAYYESGWKYTGTGLATKYETAGGVHRWYTAPSGTAGNAISFTQAMTLDASGNLGLGETSPDTRLHIYGASTAGRGQLYIQGSSTTSRFVMANSSDAYSLNTYGDSSTSLVTWDAGSGYSFRWTVADTERARITSGGDLLVGTTSLGFTPKFGISADGSSYSTITQIENTNTGVASVQMIRFTWGGTSVGRIESTSTATSYLSGSDYRLKNNPQPLTNSGTFIDALKPKTWNWKSDGSKGVGFIAHEVQEVSPSSVSGEKDGEEMQAMEYGSAEFIANIIAELQSLRQRVALLEGN